MAEHPSAATERRYERDAVSVRRIIWLGVGLIAIIAVCCAVSYGFLRQLSGGAISGFVQPTLDARSVPPQPRLERAPAETLQGYLRPERARLHSYGWIDRNRGVVRIPIERAMQILAARGDERRLPAAEEAPAEPAPTAAAGISSTRVQAAAPAHNPAREVGFDQRPGAQLPLQTQFRDESGAAVPLARYFGRRPAILVMTYYECPNLCTIVLNGLVAGLRQVTLEAGREFDVIVVSISPRDTPSLARQKKATYLKSYGRPDAAAGWHFLTGEPAQVERLARAIGFRYFYDAASRQYAHAAGIVLLTEEGKIARYLPGVAFPAQDLRLGLVETSARRIGTVTDRLWLLCYHYDAASGRYSLLVESILRLAGLVMVAALGGLIAFLVYREYARGSAARRR